MKSKAIDILQQYNLHPTLQRIAIMDYLITHRTHPTVDEVYVALYKKLPTLSKTTVYNTLKLFAEHRAALMLTIDEKKVCFDGDVSPHAHFMCRNCGKLYDLQLPYIIKEFSPEMEDFRFEETHLYYKGICKECSCGRDKN